MRLALSLLVLSLSPLPARAQAGPALPADQTRFEALYQLTFRPDSLAATTRREMMRLQLGSRLSRFESLNALRSDSVMEAVITRAERQKTAGENMTINLEGSGIQNFRTSFKEIIFKVPTARQIAVYDKIGTVRYTYQEPAPGLTWTVTPGTTASIAGYACQRATASFGGRTWEAWFAREVPLSDGPYKFYGLPGLIVKVSDSRQHFVYELLKLRQLPTPAPLALPEAGARPLAKAEFVRGKTEHERTAFEQMMANGNIRFGTPEQQEAARQRARTRKPLNRPELR